MCSKPDTPKPTPAAAAPVAPTAQEPQKDVEGTDTSTGAAGQRGSRRGDQRRAMRVDVAVANVGGNGATGLNIPQPKG